MRTPGTLKSLSKAINANVAALAVPLPEEVREAIESYLAKHEKYDDSSAERLQEELLAIWYKHITERPDRLTGFLAILVELLPSIRLPARIFQWWDLLKGQAHESLTTEASFVTNAVSALQVLLTLDEADWEDDGAGFATNPYVERLIMNWMENHHYNSTGRHAQYFEKVGRESLVLYGKRKPKDFLTILDRFFVKEEHRIKTASLLCEFIQSQPPHLYQVTQTPLFDNLLRSLQLDTSTTAVSMTLTALTMLLSYMPNSLVPYLPTLFNIYARLLFWHREKPSPSDYHNEKPSRNPWTDPAGWEICPHSPQDDEEQIPSLRSYFTILYGLYPLNFMDYIRKPHRYLRHANDPNADDVEVQPSEIRHRSERFRRGHLLHPNFYNLTIESEKTDTGRWQSSEPAEVVAECTALCIMEDLGGDVYLPDDGAPIRRSSSFLKEDTDREARNPALLSDTGSVDAGSRVPSVTQASSPPSSQLSNRDSGDTRSRSIGGGDSPTLPPHLAISPTETQLQDLIHSNRVIKTGLNQSLANDSVPSLSLSQHESTPEGPTSGAQHAPQLPAASYLPLAAPGTSSQMSHLRRRILLLENDLRFERYLKQQHMVHMGELRRRQVKESASEAELQNLIMASRNSRARFEEAKKAEMQLRKESEKRQALAKKWEAELSAKLKTLREESKKTKAHVAELERELEKSAAECERLKARVCESEVRELKWQQDLQSHEMDRSEMDRLVAEVERLTVTERDFQGREAEMSRAIEAASQAETQVEMLNMKLEAHGKELELVKGAYEEQIAALKSRLAEMQASTSRGIRGDASAKVAVEGALAASRTKQVELQEQYDHLMRRYNTLQSSLLDISSGPAHPKAEAHAWPNADGETSPISPTSTTRGRMQRMFSSPEAFDATASYNATPPLGAKPTLSPSASSSVAGGSEAGNSLPIMAPGPAVFPGRGGLQSRIRKESKDKKTQEQDKKDKKSAGIRGIRSLNLI